MQAEQSIVQQTTNEEKKSGLSDTAYKGLSSGVYAYVPHTEFTLGGAGHISMNPFHTSSQFGELEKTHQEIINMQNKMIESKKNKLIEHSLKYNDFTEEDDADHFVDFGLI